MDGLLLFIGAGAFVALVLFSVVFRRVRGELQAARNRGVPVAVIARGGAGQRGGGGLAARLAGSMPTVQAGIVATAATSIFIMVLCFVASMVVAAVR